MKNKNGLIIGSGFAASLLAFGVTSGLVSLKDASIASLVGIPAALITHVVTDSKNQKQLRDSDSKLSKALRELDTANKSVNRLAEFESKTQQLTLNLEETKTALNLTVEAHKTACTINQGMKQESEGLQAQITAFKSEIEQLQLEIEEWEEQFSDRVEVTTNEKFQATKATVIQKIFDEHDAVIVKLLKIAKAQEEWGQKVAHGHAIKREIIQQQAADYNQNIDEVKVAVTTEINNYLKQIEILHEKVARLQQKLAGDLVEPEYLECGFDQNGKIANAIANWLWINRQIPLKVTGFEAKDNSLTAGFIPIL